MKTKEERRVYFRDYYYSERGRAVIERYNNSPRGKCVRQLAVIRWKIRKATDPARLATLRDLEAAYERELTRIERNLNGESRRGPQPKRRSA